MDRGNTLNRLLALFVLLGLLLVIGPVRAETAQAEIPSTPALLPLDKKPAPQDYRTRLEQTWDQVKAVARDDTIPHKDRIQALDQFLAQFPKKNRHRKYALKLRKLLAGGGEFDSMRSVSFSSWRGRDPRTRLEWFALALGVGVYGPDTTGRLFTLRWPNFYWTAGRWTFIRGWALVGAHWGTGIGIPIHLGSDGRREWRFGLGLEFAIFFEDGPLSLNYRDGSSHSLYIYGPTVVPEIIYHWRPGEVVGWETALQMSIFPLGWGTDREYDRKYIFPIPHVSLRVGMTI